MGETTIEWTEKTWNPGRGCSVVSPGCHNCYAMKQAHRFSGEGMPYHGLTKLTVAGPQWTGAVRLVPEMLAVPLRRRAPTTWFVNSMSDLFHESFTNEEIAAVFGVMAACPQHTFQILTKRAERMVDWFAWVDTQASDRERWIARVGEAERLCNEPLGSRGAASHAHQTVAVIHRAIESTAREVPYYVNRPWPLPNVHIGVSVEDQRRADERIPLLLQTPAALRFLSVEPLLDAVDFSQYFGSGGVQDRTGPTLGISWLIVGGESGPGARPCSVEWIRSIVQQCAAAEVPCFVKQLGANYCDAANGVGGHQARPPSDLVQLTRRLTSRKGADMEEWPADLRVRQMPEVSNG